MIQNHNRLTIEESKALLKLISYAEGLREIGYLNKIIDENKIIEINSFIHSLQRLRKKELAVYFIRYISQPEITALIELIKICSPLVQICYQKNKVSREFLENWVKFIKILTRNHERWN